MLRHLLIAIFMAALIFVAGCADAACRTPIDKRCMPAHNETRIYNKMIPNGKNGFIIQPMIQTIPKPDIYQVLFIIEYDNGKKVAEWKDVSKEVYEEIIIK